MYKCHEPWNFEVVQASQPHFTHYSAKSTLLTALSCSSFQHSFSAFLANIQRIQSFLYAFLNLHCPFCKSVYENKPFPLGKMRGVD